MWRIFSKKLNNEHSGKFSMVLNTCSELHLKTIFTLRTREGTISLPSQKRTFLADQGTNRAGIKKERKTEMAYNSSFGKPAPSPGNAEASTSYPRGMVAGSRVGKRLTQCTLLLLHMKSAAWGRPSSGMMARSRRKHKVQSKVIGPFVLS